MFIFTTSKTIEKRGVWSGKGGGKRSSARKNIVAQKLLIAVKSFYIKIVWPSICLKT